MLLNFAIKNGKRERIYKSGVKKKKRIWLSGLDLVVELSSESLRKKNKM